MNCVTIPTPVQLTSQMILLHIAQIDNITEINATPHQIHHLCVCLNFNLTNSMGEASDKNAQFEDCNDEVQITAIIPPNDNELIPTISAEPEEKSEPNSNCQSSASEDHLDPECQLLSDHDGMGCNNHAVECSNHSNDTDLRMHRKELGVIKLSHKVMNVLHSSFEFDRRIHRKICHNIISLEHVEPKC